MNRTPAIVTGLLLSLLLGLLDVAGVFATGVEGSPPVGIIYTAAGLGLITLGAVMPAWRGSRPALLIVAASRAVSVLLGLPVYFVDAPTWARIATTVVIMVSLLAIAALAPALRRPPRASLTRP